MLFRGKNTTGAEEITFRDLFMDYYPSLFSFARHYVVESSIAEDLVQDVFVKIWETRENLKTIEDISAYLYQMVRFRCFNHLKGEKVRSSARQLFTQELHTDEIDNYIREETFRIVGKAMESLPPACRTIFSMTLDGYRAKDIADELHISVETIKKQKQIARRILKEKLGPSFFFLLWIYPHFK